MGFLAHQHKHGYILAVLQVVFFILFIIFVRYDPKADARYHPITTTEVKEESNHTHYHGEDPDSHVTSYPFFQDVHVMIFIGFGFLMTFLKRYGFSAVGINFIVAATALEWAILVNGFFHLHEGTIFVNLGSLLGADFTAAAVLISFGAVLGTSTPTQLIIMTIIEIPIFVVNEVIGRQYLGAVDMGDSMFVHAFGAYFGLAASIMLYRADVNTEKEGSCYRSDLYAMIGTVFLWLYWPSFNGGAAPGDDQHRAIINTLLSLLACTLTTYAISSMVDGSRKLNMVHVQNSTLAGGVAIGTAADLMVQPWGAILVGMLAGVISVLGYEYLTPFMNSRLRIHDTCGVHNLHGMPALLAGIVGCIVALMANEDTYGASLYLIFPAMAPEAGTEEFERVKALIPDIEAGSGRSASAQAGNQILALLITIIISVIGGIVTGLILRVGPIHNLRTEDLYCDDKYWLIEEDEENPHPPSEDYPMNPSGVVQEAGNNAKNKN